MIKKYFTTFAFSIIVLVSFSQTFLKDSKKGLNLSSEVGNLGVYLFPNLTLDYKNHSFAIGPLFRLYPKFYEKDLNSNIEYFPTKVSYLGFHMFYQYNFRPDMFFDYFVQTNLTYENFELTNYMNSNKPDPLYFEWKSKFLYQTLGSGFKLNFTKNLYLTMSLDLGIVLYKKYNYWAEKVRESGNTNDNFTGILRMGLGYKL